MSDKSIKSIKSIKKKYKKRLETIIEEEHINEPKKTIKPILICDGECVKCINTNCI
jgi:hypothetical protein